MSIDISVLKSKVYISAAPRGRHFGYSCFLRASYRGLFQFLNIITAVQDNLSEQGVVLTAVAKDQEIAIAHEPPCFFIFLGDSDAQFIIEALD